MRRTSDRPPLLLAPAALAAALATSCAGPAAEVTVLLRPGDGVELAPVGALKLIVRDVEEERPEVFGPISLDRERPARLPALVPPGRDFYLDVWGCPDVDTCEPSALVARGCSGVESVPEGSKDRVIAIELFPPDDARARSCPPELP